MSAHKPTHLPTPKTTTIPVHKLHLPKPPTHVRQLCDPNPTPNRRRRPPVTLLTILIIIAAHAAFTAAFLLLAE